jgi:hypothetical protein
VLHTPIHHIFRDIKASDVRARIRCCSCITNARWNHRCWSHCVHNTPSTFVNAVVVVVFSSLLGSASNGAGARHDLMAAGSSIPPALNPALDCRDPSKRLCHVRVDGSHVPRAIKAVQGKRPTGPWRDRGSLERDGAFERLAVVVFELGCFGDGLYLEQEISGGRGGRERACSETGFVSRKIEWRSTLCQAKENNSKCSHQKTRWMLRR